MRCNNCGGVSIIWDPALQGLLCLDCNSEPEGLAREMYMRDYKDGMNDIGPVNEMLS